MIKERQPYGCRPVFYNRFSVTAILPYNNSFKHLLRYAINLTYRTMYTIIFILFT